jgi:hypothetical protein
MRKRLAKRKLGMRQFQSLPIRGRKSSCLSEWQQFLSRLAFRRRFVIIQYRLGSTAFDLKGMA